MRTIFKRVICAIAEPVAVAVAAAVEQTLREIDVAEQVRIGMSQHNDRATLDRAELTALKAQRDAAIALAKLAGEVVHRFQPMIVDGYFEPDTVAKLRKLDQLADIVLGQS